MTLPPHVFKHPFKCIIAGSTQSGKTTLTKKLLQHAAMMIHPPPTHIFWCYGQYNHQQLEEIKNLVDPSISLEFIPGLPSDHEFDPKNINLVILDDLMHEGGNSQQIATLFT